MRNRPTRPTSRLSTGLSTGMLLAMALGGCTTIYGPENPPPPEETVSDQAPCEIDDTRPGCTAEDPPCQDPHDYLCGE